MHIINSTKSYRRFHCTYKSRCECSFYCAAMDSFASMLIYNLDVHDDNYIGNSYFFFFFRRIAYDYCGERGFSIFQYLFEMQYHNKIFKKKRTVFV